jgi:hypothetical protein
MKANAVFGRAGVDFYCSGCDSHLKYKYGDDVLYHPEQKGIFNRRPIPCQWAGKYFSNPFRGMPLNLAPEAKL